MSYTAKQVEEAIEATDIYWGDLHFSNADPFEITLDDETVTVYPDGFGGGVNAGPNIWVAFKVGDQYFRKTGYHECHYGTEWDGDVEEVTPRQKTITVYDSI